jgi:hypothetical protein
MQVRINLPPIPYIPIILVGLVTQNSLLQIKIPSITNISVIPAMDLAVRICRSDSIFHQVLIFQLFWRVF